VIETDPRPPRSIDPRIPREIEAILGKAMAKDASRRYPTASELADDLERFLEQRPVLAARKKIIHPAALVSAALAAAVATIILWSSRTPENPPEPPVATKPAPRVVPEKPSAPVPLPKPPAPEARIEPPPAPVAVKPNPEPAKEPVIPLLDAALADRVRTRVLDQPEYFVRTFLPEADGWRAREILTSGRASGEDAAFLRDRIDRDIAEKIEKEKEFIRASVAARLPDPGHVDAPDVVRFKGRPDLQVRVVEESEATVKCLYKGQMITYPRAEIVAILRGDAPAIQFHKKIEAATAARDLAALAEWCRENRLDLHREYVLYRIIELDPANTMARRDLGLPLTGRLRPGGGRDPAPERVGDAYVFEGKRYTAAALRQALAEKGYRVIDGHWCSTREWKWAPGEYWKKKELKFGGEGVALQSRDDVRTESRYDLDQQKLVPFRVVVPGFHFIGPVAGAETRAKGTATVEIEAPGPIVECRILAAASVIDGRGSVTVEAHAEGRDPIRLYALAVGAHRKAVDLGESLRGARKFTLVAEMNSDVASVEGRVQTFACFLPADARDPEPLVIDARIAEPAPQLDKLIPPK
jgi:hypothetical protein